MTKKFLPTGSVASFKAQEASILIDELKDQVAPLAEKVTPSHVRVPHFAKKCFPIFGMFTFFIGISFLGFSIMTVPENHIGYYVPTGFCGDCRIQTYATGTYFNLPWSKGGFYTVNVGSRNITVGGVGKPNATCVAQYSIKNVNAYINAIVLYDNSVVKLENELIASLKDVLAKRNVTNDKPFIKHGLSFNKIYYVKLV